jgi:hypothetical protein
MPAPPDPARPGPPRPAPPRPKRDYAAEEEAGRRLTNAHIQLRRGLLTEAETAVRALLAERPTDAGAFELLGDIQTTRGDLEAACASYQTALRAEQGRASAEAKFGKATLRQAERLRQEKLGVAYAASDTPLTGSGDASSGKRGGWGLLGSIICPGLGQVAGGQYVKGGILIAVYVLCLGLFALLPHGHGRGSYFGPGFWLVAIVMTADWLYAVIDTARASSRAAMPPEKDGWQV